MKMRMLFSGGLGIVSLNFVVSGEKLSRATVRGARMSEQNTYLQQEILNKPLQKHGLLEELNLPPKAIRFIRNNKRNLIIGLVVCVLGIVGWSSLNYYLDRQNDRAAGLLAEAMGQNDVVQRQTLLENLLADYGRTGSAMWAKVELGHLAFDGQQYDEAVRIYLEVRDDLAKSSPAFPLVQLNLAQAYENKNELPQALAAYQELAKIKGFAGEAYLAMGRIHELQKELPQAKEMYGKVLAEESVSPALKEKVQARLDRL
jgi:predicted negative regulator of RcsB-dependent stress response